MLFYLTLLLLVNFGIYKTVKLSYLFIRTKSQCNPPSILVHAV